MNAAARQSADFDGDSAAAPPHPADFVGDRRRFLEVMGASLAMATSGCFAQPKETIVPYVKAPEYDVPGQPRYFATAITLGGFATGVLVESHLGRPTRIDGNPDHPASLGAVDPITQSAVLSLYDPDRSQAITGGGTIRTWEALERDVEAILAHERPQGGSGVRILTQTVTSPTLAAQLERLLEALPHARWHQYEPINPDQAYEGTRLAFQQPLQTRWRIDRAEVIVALDADFLASGPGHLRYARDFMSRRQPEMLSAAAASTLNRLYVVEPMPTPTGATADHRLPLAPSRISAAAAYLAAKLDIPGARMPAESELASDARHWLDVAASDLSEHRGSGLIAAGWALPAQTQGLVARMNVALGNVGPCIEFTKPVMARLENQGASLARLADDMERGKVALLLILEGNPVFTSRPDLRLAERLGRVPLAIHLSLYHDETSACCHWHVPAAHPLESWGDARAFDGTVSLIQPLIAPLYGGKTCHELVQLLAGRKPEEKPRTSYELVREHWRRQHGEEGFESFWHRALHRGVVDGTALAAVPVSLAENERAQQGQRPDDKAGSGLEIVLRPDPTIYDGRFANNGWLQELPKPITKLTWHNAALLSPRTSRRLGLASEDEVEISAGAEHLKLPVFVVAGHADDCVTLHLGYGRRRGGRLCDGSGANAYLLLSGHLGGDPLRAKLHRTGRRQPLLCTQHHHRMEGRDLVRQATFADFRARGKSALGTHPQPPDVTLYEPPFPPSADEGYAWGMSINLTTCVGCNACVIACQAENNIPVVGPEQVRAGREMHWIRVDSYFAGTDHDPQIHQQPVPCMHCENAPCELVCPVGATVHSAEGLNEMVYNRCVGTRYCSNNCPYKVRRFNFLDFHPDTSPVLDLLPNPNVTVRSRGVMEKCTYCVQRINSARIAAQRADRTIRDGEIVTACQAACPTQAIVFGNIRDPDSRVALCKASALDYGLLTELNTRPRTTYLARLNNPHPALEGTTGASG